MSGSVSNFYPAPTTFGTTPAEGSKVVWVSVPWSSLVAANTTSTGINLLNQFNSGNFTTVQSVWVDNSTCAYPVVLTCAETLHRILCPAFSSAMFPLIVGPAPQFTLALQYAPLPSGAYIPPGSTQLEFLNLRADPALYEQLGFGGSNQAFANYINIGVGTILPAMGGGRHYAFSGMNFTINTTGTWSIAQVVQFRVQEQNSGLYLFLDQFTVTTSTTGLVYSKNLQFPTPIISLSDQTAIVASLNNNPGSGNTTLAYTVTYGVVTIA